MRLFSLFISLCGCLIVLTACTSSDISENTTTNENNTTETENNTMPNPEMSCSEDECGRFANFKAPIHTEKREDGRIREIYNTKGETLMIDYDPHTREVAKKQCKKDIIEYPLDPMVQHMAHYACEFVYGGVKITISSGSVLDLTDQDFLFVEVPHRLRDKTTLARVDFCFPRKGMSPEEYMKYNSDLGYDDTYAIPKNNKYAHCKYRFYGDMRDSPYILNINTFQGANKQAHKECRTCDTEEEFFMGWWYPAYPKENQRLESEKLGNVCHKTFFQEYTKEDGSLDTIAYHGYRLFMETYILETGNHRIAKRMTQHDQNNKQ